MNRWLSFIVLCSIVLCLPLSVSANEVDEVLSRENAKLGVKHSPVPIVDDLTYLRRLTIDLIARIPSGPEMREYKAWPADKRREMLVDKLMDHPRFTDRWTVFFADMFRLRSNTPGGSALIAYVHQAIDTEMPYDQLCRNLIKTNGRPGNTPEVAFILGDDANPLAMASVTSQVFMGVRMGCAECHDHPFDVWTRKDFYGLAAYFGKTIKVENQFTNGVYTTETDKTTILWPPMGVGEDSERKPINPKFPFAMASSQEQRDYIARLVKLRETQSVRRLRIEKLKKEAGAVDDLLAEADFEKFDGGAITVGAEARSALRDIDLHKSMYRDSDLREKLAKMVTSPRNRYFSRAIVNRMWGDLVGRGFVEPIDDFREDNLPSHPETLDYIADEFVASGYDFKTLVRLILTSDTYQRGHIKNVDQNTTEEYETTFLATPMRRMLAEALYDSIITAGHIFDVKYPEGSNIRTRLVQVRVPKEMPKDASGKPKTAIAGIVPVKGDKPAMEKMKGRMVAKSAYDLENAIELDFGQLLSNLGKPSLDKMKIKSQEELEADRMMAMKRRTGNVPGVKYITKMIEESYDDNPKFNSSLRMASPAPDGHFLRIFGQTSRAELGMLRDRSPSMRQALMILNGRLSHEASRVGTMEPIYPWIEGPKADLTKATRVAYLEILTREPTTKEVTEAKEIIDSADNDLDGMADLRWVLLNCTEFRFIP